MEKDGLDPVREYSVVTLGASVPQAAANPNGFTVRILQTMFVIFAMVMPVMHMGVLFVLWNLPMLPETQTKMTEAKIPPSQNGHQFAVMGIRIRDDNKGNTTWTRYL